MVFGVLIIDLRLMFENIKFYVNFKEYDFIIMTKYSSILSPNL